MKLSLVIFAVISSLIIGCGGAGPEGPEGPVDMPTPTASGTTTTPSMGATPLSVDAAPSSTGDAAPADTDAGAPVEEDVGPVFYCVIAAQVTTTIGSCDVGVSQLCGPSGLASPTAYGPTGAQASCSAGPLGAVSANLNGTCTLVVPVTTGGLVCSGVVRTSP